MSVGIPMHDFTVFPFAEWLESLASWVEPKNPRLADFIRRNDHRIFGGTSTALLFLLLILLCLFQPFGNALMSGVGAGSNGHGQSAVDGRLLAGKAVEEERLQTFTFMALASAASRGKREKHPKPPPLLPNDWSIEHSEPSGGGGSNPQASTSEGTASGQSTSEATQIGGGGPAGGAAFSDPYANAGLTWNPVGENAATTVILSQLSDAELASRFKVGEADMNNPAFVANLRAAIQAMEIDSATPINVAGELGSDGLVIDAHVTEPAMPPELASTLMLSLLGQRGTWQPDASLRLDGFQPPCWLVVGDVLAPSGPSLQSPHHFSGRLVSCLTGAPEGLPQPVSYPNW